MSTDEFAPVAAPQKSAFLGGEGNAYEVRNRNAESLGGESRPLSAALSASVRAQPGLTTPLVAA